MKANRVRKLHKKINGTKHHLSFRRKDSIIRNIEITVACIVAFMVGMGLYGII